MILTSLRQFKKASIYPKLPTCYYEAKDKTQQTQWSGGKHTFILEAEIKG